MSGVPLPTVLWMAIAPEVVLGLGAALLLLIDIQWRPPRRVLGWVAGGLLGLAAAFTIAQWGYVEEVIAGEGAAQRLLPFAGMVVIDQAAVLGRIGVLVAAALGVASGWRLFEALGARAAEALALVLLSAAGFQLMAAGTHLVLIFLGLEVGSIALYVLAGITRERSESDEAALKYFLLGSVASAVFIYGAALTFAATGHLTLTGQGEFLAATVLTQPAVLLLGLALLVVGLGFKVTAAPFHAWAPDVYQGAPAGIVGFMAAAAKIGGFAALLRILLVAFPALRGDWAPVVAGIAALSMVVGVVLAIVQDDLRRILAYSGVAHAGYILTGVVAGGAGAGDVWFYLLVYTVQVVAAFAVVAGVAGATESRSDLASYAGLARRSPLGAGALAVMLLAMGGLPLTSGFVAKFGVFQAAWRTDRYEWLVLLGVLTSVAAFAFYLRVIMVMYMQEPDAPGRLLLPLPTRWVLGVATLATVFFGVLPAPLLDLAADAIQLPL